MYENLRIAFRLVALAALALLFQPAAPAAAADNGEVIIVEGICPTGQHVDLGGSCVCNDSTMIVVDQVCVTNPNLLFTDLGGIFIDACEFVGFCDGGGGSGGDGGGGTPPSDGEECLFEDEEGDVQTCRERWDGCGTDALADTESCEESATLARCGGTPNQVTFPDGSKATCRLIDETGKLFCTFGDSLQNPPLVGSLSDFIDRCQESWLASGQLDGEIQACRDQAIDEFNDCQADVLADCQECGFIPPITLNALGPVDAPPPQHELWLRAKVRTKGESAIDAEAFVRNATKSTCFWHLTAEGTLPPDAVLYCRAGDHWEDVGSARFLMADGDAYLADGACGVATPDGVVSGDASFRWKLERDETGALLGAKVKSLAGTAVGSLDGAHPYFGDCRLKGKAVDERDVPSDLIQQVGTGR